MTQLEIKPTTAEKLQEISEQAQKSVDEILMLLLNRFGHTVIEADETNEEDATWTDEELAELLQPKEPLTGKEMVEQGLIGGWEDMGITDSVAWLEEQRAKRRKKFEW